MFNKDWAKKLKKKQEEPCNPKYIYFQPLMERQVCIPEEIWTQLKLPDRVTFAANRLFGNT